MNTLSAAHALPALRATTRPLPGELDLLRFADPHDPLVWLRDRRGFVGRGEVLRLTARGADRFAELAGRWRELAATAEVDDPVGLPASGLLAFGAVAFGDTSAAESVLIVPETVLHRHDDRWFITEMCRADDQAGVDRLARCGEHLPEIAAAGLWTGCALDPSLEGEAAERYCDTVATVQRRFAAGEAEKVVLARAITGELDAAADLRVPLARLAERYRTGCWTFAVDGLLGASPETLIRLVDQRATALVLAGTAPRHHDDRERDLTEKRFLETAPHIEHEHRLAAESVIETLSPLVTSLTASDAPRVLQLPNVWHRATDVAAIAAPEASALHLVAALHPTAAIAGTPRDAAVRLIAELEPGDRGRYSGAVGWIDGRGDGEWAIALRCAQLGADAGGSRTLTAWAGGGIVPGSDPHAELAETVSKFAPIVEAFQGGAGRGR